MGFGKQEWLYSPPLSLSLSLGSMERELDRLPMEPRFESKFGFSFSLVLAVEWCTRVRRRSRVPVGCQAVPQRQLCANPKCDRGKRSVCSFRSPRSNLPKTCHRWVADHRFWSGKNHHWFVCFRLVLRQTPSPLHRSREYSADTFTEGTNACRLVSPRGAVLGGGRWIREETWFQAKGDLFQEILESPLMLRGRGD